MKDSVRQILESLETPSIEQIELIKTECSADPEIMNDSLWQPWFSRNLETIITFTDTIRAAPRVERNFNAEMMALLEEAISYNDGAEIEQFDSMLEWYYDWRDRAHTLVRTIQGLTQSSKKD